VCSALAHTSSNDKKKKGEGILYWGLGGGGFNNHIFTHRTEQWWQPQFDILAVIFKWSLQDAPFNSRTMAGTLLIARPVYSIIWQTQNIRSLTGILYHVNRHLLTHYLILLLNWHIISYMIADGHIISYAITYGHKNLIYAYLLTHYHLRKHLFVHDHLLPHNVIYDHSGTHLFVLIDTLLRIWSPTDTSFRTWSLIDT